MVQYPRHAVVEFHPDWAIKSWHCVLCGSQCDSQEQLKSHLQIHEIKDVIATVITTGNLQNGAAINFKHSFITDSTADVSISTGDVAAHVKKEINDSDDYMPLEEVESDNESFGAKLEPNDDDSEIPEFKIEAVHSDDNENSDSLEMLEDLPYEIIRHRFNDMASTDIEGACNSIMILKDVQTNLFHCSKCTAKSKWKHSIRRHILCKHKDNVRCADCHQIFSSKKFLKEHRLLDHSENYKCDKCCKTFSVKSCLRVHQKVKHQKGSNINCGMEGCSKVFVSNAQYQDHIDSHHKTKRHTCDICNSAFTYRCNLTKHLKTCATKDQKFIMNKPERYMCELCSCILKNKEAYNDHLKGKHKNGPCYQCPCGKQFFHRASYYRHKQTCVGLKFD